MSATSMTPKERVIAQINHQETDPIPYTLGFDEEGHFEERLDDHFGSDAWQGLLDSAIRSLPRPGTGVIVDETVERYYTDAYGTTWQVDRRPYGLVEPALKEPSLEGYEFPDVDALFDPDWEDEARREIEEQGDHFLVASFGFGLFERSWTIRGFDNTMKDVAAHPDFYDELVERIADHHLEMVERVLGLPIDGVMLSDDWGYQRGVIIGAERWRRFLKPRMARLYARAHEAGKYTLTHCCGSIEEIIPDLIEIGLDVYESVQPEAKNNSPYELKQKYGDEITFWGGLGSQTTIPFGTPEEIKAEVARLCREMGRGGGYILAPAKVLQPETSIDNAAAVVEAFLEQAGVAVPRG